MTDPKVFNNPHHRHQRENQQVQHPMKRHRKWQNKATKKAYPVKRQQQK